MAEEQKLPQIDSEEPEETPGYVAPAKKSIDEIAQLDQNDESLVKYKETLLAKKDPASCPDDDPRRVIVEKMVFVTENNEHDIELDLTGDLSKFKSNPIVVKEGITYRIKIVFKIHHEIVPGLKYHHVIKRSGINADKVTYMVGSYGPKAESYEYLSPPDDAPKGMIYRSNYTISSKFVDDDKEVHLAWEWVMAIKKDWKD